MNIIVDGLHVSGRDEGQGPVMLALHGWQADSSTFDALKSNFNGYRIIAPDLPGFGGSQLPTKPWGVEEYAQFVANLLAKLNVAEVEVVVGHSFGGRIALSLLGSTLISPKRLVLLASHGLPESKSLRQSFYWLAAKIGKLVSIVLPSGTRDKLKRKLYQSAGSEDYLMSGNMKQTFIKVINQDATEDLKRIKTPTLLIYGSEDKTTPISLGKRIEALLPESKLVEVSGAGHYVHIDKPTEVVASIKSFLS